MGCASRGSTAPPFMTDDINEHPPSHRTCSTTQWAARAEGLLLLLALAHVGLIDHLLRHDLGRGERRQVLAIGGKRVDLRLDPGVREAEALLDGHVRRPAEDLLDERVVRVAAAHTLRARDVLDREVLRLARDL